jgi:hypothetical protein
LDDSARAVWNDMLVGVAVAVLGLICVATRDGAERE